MISKRCVGTSCFPNALENEGGKKSRRRQWYMRPWVLCAMVFRFLICEVLDAGLVLSTISVWMKFVMSSYLSMKVLARSLPYFWKEGDDGRAF